MEVEQIYGKFDKNMGWLRDRTVLLVRHGSHAYGTNTPESDEDFKGIAIPPKQYFLGSQYNFEQAELKDPDLVIYDIRKFFNLAAASNPNIIEVLHTDPSDHILVDPIGEIILDNKNRFLSKRIKHTFMGYACSQLKRIKLHRRWLLNPPTHKPTREEFGLPRETVIPQDQLLAVNAQIQKELDKFQFDFMEELNEPMKIAVRNSMADMLTHLQISKDDQWVSAAKTVGLDSNFIEAMKLERQYASSKTEWDNFQEWKVNRNRKRHELEAKYGYDTKHAYHLVRLIRMCGEILTTGIVTVKRPDFEELLRIRNGAWTCEEVIEYADNEEVRLQELYKTSTVLPKTPDQKYLDDLCIQLVERSLSKYSWYNVKKYIDTLVK